MGAMIVFKKSGFGILPTPSRVFLTLSFALLGLAGAAQRADLPAGFSFLSAAARDKLVSEGSVVEAGGRLTDLGLWKGAPFDADLLSLVGPMPTTLAAESWTIVRGSGVGDEGATATGSSRALAIFRAFTAFSTMKGLKTKSAIFPGYEKFIVDSYRVDSATTRRKLPDPEVAVAPAAATYELYGKDALAGDVYYLLDFRTGPSWYRVTLRNETTMRSLVLKLADPGKLLTVFYILPAGPDLLLYGLTLAETPLVPGTIGLERTILTNRMIAIGKWFAGNVSGAVAESR